MNGVFKGARTSCVIGERHTNNNGEMFTIIGYDDDARLRHIRFDSGYETTVIIAQITKGNIRDLGQKTICEVACSGMKNPSHHPLYYRWLNMLKRCYDKKHHHYSSYGAKGVYVEDYFLTFKNYAEYVSTLDNYDLLLASPKDWHIDKDVSGKRYYGRDTVNIIKSKDNLELGAKNKRIKVEQLDFQGNILAEYESIWEAGITTGIPRINIGKAVGQDISVGGFLWRRKTDN